MNYKLLHLLFLLLITVGNIKSLASNNSGYSVEFVDNVSNPLINRIIRKYNVNKSLLDTSDYL